MSPERDALPESTAESLESFVEEWRETADLPGVSVALFDGDGVLYEGGFGVRDRESSAPATADTLYAVGSVTKPVTALAVLQLVDRGLVSLDDGVGEHVSVLTDVPGDHITVRELLSHSSGLPRDFVTRYEELASDETEGRLAFVDDAAVQRLTDRPRYMYSNSGYFVLGELIERVDGRPYSEYVREEVFAPLGMDRSGFDPARLVSDDDAMTGYRRDDGELVADEIEAGAGAAGGLVTSVHQLAPLLRCVLTDGAVDGRRLLSADLVEEMCGFQSPLLPADDDRRRGYGLGWELSEFLGETLVAHRGGIYVSGGYVGVLCDHGVGVALAFNALGRPLHPYAEGVLALACDERPRDAVPLLAVYDVVDTVTGTYTAYRDAMTVTVDEGPAATIEIDLPDERTFTATPDAVAEPPYTFSQTMGGGVRWVAEFRTVEADTELVLSTGKWTTVLTDDG